MDLFASSSNCIVPRFFARYPEPLAEAVDALSQPDWAFSRCQSCNRRHQECCFVFLLPLVLRKAEVDCLQGIFVVPFAVTDPTWQSLMGASVSAGWDRYRACDHRVVSNAPASGVQRLAIIAVDFHRLRQQPDLEVAAPCAQAAALRLRRSLQSSTDEEDRRRIGFALQLGGACSTATVASGRHAPGLSGSGPSTSRRRLW